MSLADYNANAPLQTRILNEVARAAGVSVADVTLAVSDAWGGAGRRRSLQSAAVRVRASIAAASVAVADFISGRLADATADDLGITLGVSVLAVTAPQRGTSFVDASGTTASKGDDDDSRMPIALVIAGVVAAVFVVSTCCLITAERSGKPLFSSLPAPIVVTKPQVDATISNTSTSSANAAAEKL